MTTDAHHDERAEEATERDRHNPTRAERLYGWDAPSLRDVEQDERDGGAW
jgi:hypothetical protein